MPAQTILASVIDITKDAPKRSDRFMVDSQVWIWLAYARSSPVTPSPIPRYLAYVKQARRLPCHVCFCGPNWAEVAHHVEKTELEIHQSCNPHPKYNLKQFRHELPAERAKVVAQLHAAWTTIKVLCSVAPILLDSQTLEALQTRFGSQPLDGYDLMILETMAANGITQIVTDDRDYASASGIQVFTANIAVIQEANRQGKLVVR